ncbi:MAG: type IX secretion system membrane protein PorP/SprF [Bacteroidales bacterium]
MRIQGLVFLFLLILCSGKVVTAQQEAQFSHNMFNNMGINPGYAGLRNAICATALARQQWVGLRDINGVRLNPETYSLNVDAPIPFLRGGLAVGFLQDQLGFETNIGFKLSYAYHLQLDFGKLGLGGQIGFLDKRLDFGQLEPITPGDPVLIGGEESHMYFDFALGVFYMADNQSYAGISVSQARQATGYLGESDYTLRRHLFATAGYHYTLPSQPAYIITPSALIKTDLESFQFDLNTLVTYNNRFWGGVSFRPRDALVFLLGVHYEQMSIGYSYDVTTSRMGAMGRSHGSHEIMLRYCFELDLDKIQEIQRNIRFL